VSKKRLSYIIIIIILFTSAFLRLYRIYESTEFLGDQGREGIVIYNWIKNGIFPLLGPPVSTGQYLGPFFYYLIAPSFIISSFNPLGPAIFMVLLDIATVLLILYLADMLYGFRIGLATAAIYATSPLLIQQSRTLWNPTPIPFFITILLIGLYKIRGRKVGYKWFLLVGASFGALIQLHYTTFILLSFLSIFWAYLFFVNLKRKGLTDFLIKTLLGFISFIIILLPFFYYEFTHNFENISAVILNLLLPKTGITPIVPFHLKFAELFSRISFYLAPIQNKLLSILLLLFLFTVPVLIKAGFWHIFYSLWLIGGILSLTAFQGNIPDHYLRFLVPLPFLILGSFLHALNKGVLKKIAALFSFALLMLNLSKLDTFSKELNDIQRVDNITNEIISNSKNKPFSFTLISSRSFSDLHYRYFFLIKNIKPEYILSNKYNYLFLVCEKKACPTEREIKNINLVQALCYNPLCDKQYPKISLENWQFTTSRKLNNSTLYAFRKHGK
jgi:hypothetical protein